MSTCTIAHNHSTDSIQSCFPFAASLATCSVRSKETILKPSIYRIHKRKQKTTGARLRLAIAGCIDKPRVLASTSPKSDHSSGRSKPKASPLILHIAGINDTSSHPTPTSKAPKSKSSLSYPGLNLPILTTIESTVLPTDTVEHLHRFLSKHFNVPSSASHKMAIIYASHFLSSDQTRFKSLESLNITNHSLLLVAFNTSCFALPTNQTIPPQPHSIKPFSKCKGLDIITQEQDCEVFTMPVCGHLMSKASLFDYAQSQFSTNNLIPTHISCPHTNKQPSSPKPIPHQEVEEEKYWECLSCAHSHNDMSSSICAGCDKTTKPWACSHCTLINVGTAQTCECCTIKRTGDEPSKPPSEAFMPPSRPQSPLPLLCGAQWSYSELKPLLVSYLNSQCKDEVDSFLLESELHLKSALNDYFVLRRCYSQIRATKHKGAVVSMYLQRKIRAVQKRLIAEFNVPKHVMSAVRCKARECVDGLEVKQQGDFVTIAKGKSMKGNGWEYTAKLELVAARNTLQSMCALQTCPGCDTLHCEGTVCGEKGGLKRQCVMCEETAFCFSCGDKWQIDHMCDALFMLQLEEILTNAETKTVGYVEGVPAIRCCPTCCQLITHTEACKHMQCQQCKTKFCFVCLKPYVDDSWQCGSSSDVCPVADRQNAKTLPKIETINAKSFRLF